MTMKEKKSYHVFQSTIANLQGHRASPLTDGKYPLSLAAGDFF